MLNVHAQLFEMEAGLIKVLLSRSCIKLNEKIIA